MKIIISPAKKMKIEENISPLSKPVFLKETEILLEYLRSLTEEEKGKLWKIKGKLLASSISELERIDLSLPGSPALFSYDGIQYTYMSPSSFTDSMLDYVSSHLRIISGLYGALRPMDGVMPYRLEMEARVKLSEGSLYSFWGDKIAGEIGRDESVIVNLASDEYSKAVLPFLKKDVRVITPVFLDKNGDKLITKGVYAKMERGEMVRYMAENRITEPEELAFFSYRGYRYSEKHSSASLMAFVRAEN